jgi:hypothetical protein
MMIEDWVVFYVTLKKLNKYLIFPNFKYVCLIKGMFNWSIHKLSSACYIASGLENEKIINCVNNIIIPLKINE